MIVPLQWRGVRLSLFSEARGLRPMPFVVFVILAVLAVLLLLTHLIAKRWLR